MKNAWCVIYYETVDGKCPVRDFINSRNKENQTKILSMINYLEEHGPHLPRPYADLLADGIHELRTKLSGDEGRTLYFFCYKRFIILTHTFIKHENVVPTKEINKAITLRTDFLNRYTEKNLIKLEKEENENI
jgi:hypothetical protein